MAAFQSGFVLVDSTFLLSPYPKEFPMKQTAIIAATAATLMTLALASAPAAAAEKEKCFGIAKAGQNDCASGVHSCAGQSKVDMDKVEWKYVAKGTCKDMKGLSADEAKKLKS
jgi:uncharacterized membrane protein